MLVDLLTKVLHILIASKCQWAALLLAALCASLVSLEHDNTVRSSSCDKCSAVAELCPFAVVVEEDVAQGVSDRGE